MGSISRVCKETSWKTTTNYIRKTEILKEVYTPIAEENKKLKEDLHTVYQKFKN